jgi:hypothetical protein
LTVYLYSIIVTIILMRFQGVAVRSIDMPSRTQYTDEMEITETREQRLSRVIRIARLNPIESQPSFNPLELWEPHVLWMHEQRFVLTPFRLYLKHS